MEKIFIIAYNVAIVKEFHFKVVVLTAFAQYVFLLLVFFYYQIENAIASRDKK